LKFGAAPPSLTGTVVVAWIRRAAVAAFEAGDERWHVLQLAAGAVEHHLDPALRVP